MSLRPWMVSVVLTVAVAAAHGGALRGAFHYDDKVSVVENLAIRQWQPWFYLTSPFAASSEPGAAGYRPLTVASFATNYMVNGLEPSGYLFGNVLLHLTISWLVYLLGRRLLRHEGWAALAAVIYALHPINAEAVNYVVARSSLLATCASLLACLAFLRRVGGGGIVWMACGVAAMGAALLSKESAAALVVPLATYWWVARTEGAGPDHETTSVSTLWRGLRPALPYIAVFFVYLAQWRNVAGAQVAAQPKTAAYPLWTFFEIVGRSLLLWVYPYPLGLDHPLVFVTRFDAVTAAWLVAQLSLVLGLLVTCWRWRPLAGWCLLWALAGLAVLAPLPWITVKGLMQENRMTFSAVGLAWLTAIAVRDVVAAWRRRRAGQSPLVRRMGKGIVTAGTVGVFVLAVAVDRSRSAVWADDVRLWQEAVSRTPESRTARINLGVAYMARDDFDRAEQEFRRAVTIAPNDTSSYYALGVLSYRREDYELAKLFFLKTASLSPDYAQTYRMLGIIAIKQHRDDDATAFFRRALMLDPRDSGALANLGLLAQRAGNDAAAMSLYRETLAINPDQGLARNNLGALYLKTQRWAEALEQFSALTARRPDDYDAALNRAAALNELGRKEEARAALQGLLERLPPDHRYDSHRWGATLLLSRLGP